MHTLRATHNRIDDDMDNSLLAAAFALSAATAWGSGDFTSGIATRRIGPFRTVLVSYTVGLVALVIVALARFEELPPPIDMMWGALGGIAGMVGLVFLLRGFDTGRMGIVAPVSAVLAASIPVIFAAVTEGLPRQLQLLGFGLGLVGIWLLSRPEGSGVRPAGLDMALLAGLGFGLFFTALGLIGSSGLFWPLVSGRLAACALMIAFAVSKRRSVVPPRSAVGLLALAGVLDVGGNLFFLLSVQTGRLDVAAVLASFYPAVTATLARVVAREHMARLQVIGVAVAVLAIILITI